VILASIRLKGVNVGVSLLLDDVDKGDRAGLVGGARLNSNKCMLEGAGDCAHDVHA
jgi:hypothetical protein